MYTDSPAPRTMTLASYNCLHGIDLTAGRPDPMRPVTVDAVADALAGLGADVIALQEVDRALARSGSSDQVGELATRLGMHGVFGPALLGDPDRSWVPAPSEDPGGGAYGVGVLSRFPIVRTARLRLPGGSAGERAGPGGRPLAMAAAGERGAGSADAAQPDQRQADPAADGARAQTKPGWDREPRVALRVEIAHPAATVAVTTTHLSYLPWRSLRQLRAAARFAGARLGAAGAASFSGSPGVRVLAGDLNLPAGVAGVVLPGWRRCDATPTYPADDPRLQVDQILVRGPAAVTRSATLPALTSDHLPVVATLQLPGR